jgi:hypothetical protein
VLNSPVWRGSPAVAFCLGLVAGGVVAATVLVIAGSLIRLPIPELVRVVLVAAVMVVIALRELKVVSFWLPQKKRQIPESVFRLGRHAGPFQFGLEMGTGVRTYLPGGLPYVAAVAVLLLASVPAALATGAGFGLGRSLMTASNLRFSDDNSWDDEWLAHGRVLSLLLGSAFVAALVVILLAVSGEGA